MPARLTPLTEATPLRLVCALASTVPFSEKLMVFPLSGVPTGKFGAPPESIVALRLTVPP